MANNIWQNYLNGPDDGPCCDKYLILHPGTLRAYVESDVNTTFELSGDSQIRIDGDIGTEGQLFRVATLQSTTEEITDRRVYAINEVQFTILEHENVQTGVTSIDILQGQIWTFIKNGSHSYLAYQDNGSGADGVFGSIGGCQLPAYVKSPDTPWKPLIQDTDYEAAGCRAVSVTWLRENLGIGLYDYPYNDQQPNFYFDKSQQALAPYADDAIEYAQSGALMDVTYMRDVVDSELGKEPYGWPEYLGKWSGHVSTAFKIGGPAYGNLLGIGPYGELWQYSPITHYNTNDGVGVSFRGVWLEQAKLHRKTTTDIITHDGEDSDVSNARVLEYTQSIFTNLDIKQRGIPFAVDSHTYDSSQVSNSAKLLTSGESEIDSKLHSSDFITHYFPEAGTKKVATIKKLGIEEAAVYLDRSYFSSTDSTVDVTKLAAEGKPITAPTTTLTAFVTPTDAIIHEWLSDETMFEDVITSAYFGVTTYYTSDSNISFYHEIWIRKANSSEVLLATTVAHSPTYGPAKTASVKLTGLSTEIEAADRVLYKMYARTTDGSSVNWDIQVDADASRAVYEVISENKLLIDNIAELNGSCNELFNVDTTLEFHRNEYNSDSCEALNSEWIAENLGIGKYGGPQIASFGGIVVYNDIEIEDRAPTALFSVYEMTTRPTGVLAAIKIYGEGGFGGDFRLYGIDDTGGGWIYYFPEGSYPSASGFAGTWIRSGESAVTAHVAEVDPHPQYLTPDELPSTVTSWFTDDVNPINGAYLTTYSVASTQAQSTVSVTGTVEDTPVLLGQWLRNTPIVNEIVWNETNTRYNLDIDCTNSNAEVFARIYRWQPGNILTLLAETDRVQLDNLRKTYIVDVNVSGPITLDSGDSVVTHIYLNKNDIGTDPIVTLFMEGSNVTRYITTVPLAAFPAEHATSHEVGGSDLINHDNLTNAQGFKSHATIDDELIVWKNQYIGGTYLKNDFVRDGVWTMIANKDTTDRPAPTPVGDVNYLIPDAPTWSELNETTNEVVAGARYTVTDAFYGSDYRIWIPVAGATVKYSVYFVQDPEGQEIIESLLSDHIADQTGWLTINGPLRLIPSGSVFDMVLITHLTGAASTFGGEWNYATSNTIPTTGQVTHDNGDKSILRISKTDNLGADFNVSLGNLQVGDEITAGGFTWSIESLTDEGTYYTFEVFPGTQIIQGLLQFTFTQYTPAPIEYVELPNFWNSNTEVQGLFSTTGYDNKVFSQNAYGIDIEVQQALISDDWDVVATSEGGTGGGGGDLPAPHAGTHESGGTDEILHDNLVGATGQQSHFVIDQELATHDTGISNNANAISSLDGDLQTHKGNQTNPHNVTSAQLGIAGSSTVHVTSDEQLSDLPVNTQISFVTSGFSYVGTIFRSGAGASVWVKDGSGLGPFEYGIYQIENSGSLNLNGELTTYLERPGITLNQAGRDLNEDDIGGTVEADSDNATFVVLDNFAYDGAKIKIYSADHFDFSIAGETEKGIVFVVNDGTNNTYSTTQTQQIQSGQWVELVRRTSTTWALFINKDQSGTADFPVMELCRLTRGGTFILGSGQSPRSNRWIMRFDVETYFDTSVFAYNDNTDSNNGDTGQGTGIQVLVDGMYEVSMQFNCNGSVNGVFYVDGSGATSGDTDYYINQPADEPVIYYTEFIAPLTAGTTIDFRISTDNSGLIEDKAKWNLRRISPIPSYISVNAAQIIS